MSDNATRGEFTGRHMLAVMVIGFGIVIAVNFFMASVAASSFSGVIVENSYVASQKFNGWLSKAEEQQAFGWSAEISRSADGRLSVSTDGVPADAQVAAELRRPLGEAEVVQLELASAGDHKFASRDAIDSGRWIVRLQITSAGREWRAEHHLP